MKNSLALPALFVCCLASAQQTGTDSSTDKPNTIVRSTRSEVSVDFVVRDKHQKLVGNLREAEVSVFEDGVPMQLRSFRFAEGPDAAASPASLPEPRLITLVFQEMSADGRREALEMARKFLSAPRDKTALVGVFALTTRLSLLQSYTNDPELLARAVEAAGKGDFFEFAKKSAEEYTRLRTIPNRGRAPNDPQSLAADSAAAQFRPVRNGSAEERIPQLDGTFYRKMMRILEMEIKVLGYQQTMRTMGGLRFLIGNLAGLPGRKTMLYFSEGLQMPPDMPELMTALTGEANRANVTFYTVDTTGLNTEIISRIGEAETLTMSMNDPTLAGSSRGNPVENMSELAESTGGFMVHNGGDVEAQFRKLVEEALSHYEVSYSPTAEGYDGHFHKLEVKLSRPGLRLQSRNGYFAVPLLAGEAVMPFEMPALHALEANPLPHAFDYLSGVVRFRPAADGMGCEVVFELPAVRLKFVARAPTHTFLVHPAFLALIRDSQGNVVE